MRGQRRMARQTPPGARLNRGAMTLPASLPGWLLESRREAGPRGMTVHDRTRLNGRLLLFFFHRVVASESLLVWFLVCFSRQGFHSPAGACPSWSEAFTRLRRASHFPLLAQRKVTKGKGTPMPRSPGILPCDFARVLRGSLTAHPCAGSELAGIPAGHPAGLFSAPSPRHRGPGQRASCAPKKPHASRGSARRRSVHCS